MYFWLMICQSLRSAAAGAITELARKVDFSAAVIVGTEAPISELRALTKSMCAPIPFRYAARAVAVFPALNAASAFTNWSWA